jgi:hypothetical protein
VDPLDVFSRDDEDDYSLFEDFEGAGNENSQLSRVSHSSAPQVSAGGSSAVSLNDLSRLASVGRSQTTNASPFASGLPMADLFRLAFCEHLVVQNIMQVLAGLDYHSIAPVGSNGALYAGLLQVTRAPLRVGNLFALLRPSDWTSFDQRLPLTWDVLGRWELAVGKLMANTNTRCKSRW